MDIGMYKYCNFGVWLFVLCHDRNNLMYNTNHVYSKPILCLPPRIGKEHTLCPGNG